MRLAYFTSSQVGISQTFISDLIIGLEKKVGKDSFLHVVGEKSGEKVSENTAFTSYARINRFINLAFRLIDILIKPKINYLFKYQEWVVNKKLLRIIKQWNPDVAYVEFGPAAIKLRSYLNKNKIPFVVHFHGYDASLMFNSKTYTREVKKVFEDASSLLAPSFHLKRLLILRGCSQEKIHVIRIGINTNEIVPLSFEERKSFGPSIAFLGRLTPKKNPVALLHAFSIVKNKIPNAKLTVIGDGQLMSEVRYHLENLKLDNNVQLLGSIPREKAFKILNNHWVFAQHSVIAEDGDQEGLPVSIAEASAHELAIVSTIHSGIPEEVEDGKTGFLVREFDYEEMAERIIELLNDYELCRKMGTLGREKIINMSNPQIRINKIHDLLVKGVDNTTIN